MPDPSTSSAGTLKLAPLPDRTPVKLTIAVLPEFQQMLTDYAALYAEFYGKTARIEDLIPAMLAVFLDTDKVFMKRVKGG